MNNMKNQYLDRLLRAASRAYDEVPGRPLSYVTEQRVLAGVRKLRSPIEEATPTGFFAQALCVACCVMLLAAVFIHSDSAPGLTRTELAIANSSVMSNLLP